MKFSDIIEEAKAYGFAKACIVASDDCAPDDEYAEEEDDVSYTLRLVREHTPGKLATLAIPSSNHRHAATMRLPHQIESSIIEPCTLKITAGGSISWIFDGFDSETGRQNLLRVELQRQLLVRGIPTVLLSNAAGLKTTPPRLGWPVLLEDQPTGSFRLTTWQGTIPKTRYQDHRNIRHRWKPNTPTQELVDGFSAMYLELQRKDQFDLKKAAILWTERYGDKSAFVLEATTRKLTVHNKDRNFQLFEIINDGGNLCLTNAWVPHTHHPELSTFLTTFLPLCPLGTGNAPLLDTDSPQPMASNLDLI